nr:MAG TPA: hypothetical protein [Herelleviridae sp.]
MSTVNELITELTGVKNDIKNALVAKGVDMSGVPFTGYASKIEGISTGGGELERIDCIVSGVNSTKGVTVTMPAGGYYLYYLMYGYQQFDNSNETCRYVDTKGVAHAIHSMHADSYGYSPTFYVNLCFDLRLFETEETIKSMTSFKLTFNPASRNPHFVSFKAQALSKF